MTNEERAALVATLYDFSFRFGGLKFLGFEKYEMPAGIDRAAHQIEADGKRIAELEAELAWERGYIGIQKWRIEHLEGEVERRKEQEQKTHD